MNVSVAPSQAAVYELAFQEGRRVLGEQGALMEAFRGRAGLLLSAAAIATSFLGGASLEAGFSPWSWVAIATFCALGAGVASILWPRGRDEQFTRPDHLIEEYAEPDPLELPAVHRDLALHMSVSYRANRVELQRLITIVRGCSALLLVEIAFWVVDLIVKG